MLRPVTARITSALRGRRGPGAVDVLALYHHLRTARAVAFSRLTRRSFGAFGDGSLIELPVLVHGARRIRIGAGVYIGADSWLASTGEDSLLEIGDGTRLSGHCVLSAVDHVRIGRSVLFGRGVYVADHNHGTEDPRVPIADQPLTGIAPVAIEDGAWLGQNAVILAGVTVGAGAVVGANAVVLDDVPPRTVAVGAPARVVRQLPDAG